MKFLLDENVPRSIKKFLQEKGFKTLTLKELHGISNGEVAKLSIEKDAIIITFDSDFLKLKKAIEKDIKAIYIKIHPRDPKVARDLLSKEIKSCLAYLEKPGIIILTQDGVILKER